MVDNRTPSKKCEEMEDTILRLLEYLAKLGEPRQNWGQCLTIAAHSAGIDRYDPRIMRLNRIHKEATDARFKAKEEQQNGADNRGTDEQGEGNV